ncbi:MAG: hypothetical protein H6832_06785 [Planctomycetes bacterium]|nr:hypothetical protein [Planctomycetota bacterium]MCB9918092.1 hypothetical protein [Planctomycetota bacterium]
MRRHATLLWLGLPLLTCASFVALEYALQLPARLGDDWIYFHEFDSLPLLGSDGSGALTKNGTPEDGLRFRPLCYAWLFVERRLVPNFAGSHAIGILWIALGGVALASWLVTLGIERMRAGIAGTIFVLHPAQVEVWGWASARIDTMAMAMALFGLTALAARKPKRSVAFVLLACAYGSKESAYPIAIFAPLVPLLRGLPFRRAFEDAAISLSALVAIFVTKGLVLGSAFAGSWSAALREIPLWMHVRGWLADLHVLLVDPHSSAAPFGHVWAAFWFGVLVLAITTPLAVLATTSRLRQRRMIRTWRARMPVHALMAIGFLLTIAVSFGVGVRPDLAGGRLWYLPSAFVCASIAIWSPRVLMAVWIATGAVLLHENLAPYREASKIMTTVEERLAREVANPRAAIRVEHLPKEYGPVPLFFLMAELWTFGRDGLAPDTDATRPSGYPRVFLTWSSTGEPRDLTAVDAVWSEEMQRRGHDIVRLTYADGELVERR